MKVTDVRLRKIQTQDAVMKVYDETDEVNPNKNATSDNEESDEA